MQGMLSLFAIIPDGGFLQNPKTFRTKYNSPEEAIYNDFKNIGRDIKMSMEKYEKELINNGTKKTEQKEKAETATSKS